MMSFGQTGTQRRDLPNRQGGVQTLLGVADAELVERLLVGEEPAFDQLVDRYHGSLVRLAQAFVSSRAIAEEVAQETWLAVLRGLPRFEGRASLKNWIFRILSNRAKTRGVREGRSIPFSALGPEGEDGSGLDLERVAVDDLWAGPPAVLVETPERRLLWAELDERIREAIETLPEKQRAVITLRDVEGFDSEEVSALLGVSQTYQRVLLHRARTKVREALEALL